MTREDVMHGDVDDTTPQPARTLFESPPVGTAVVDWGAASSVGLVRSENEDRWVHLGAEAFAVADGMGGHGGGGGAATAAVAAFSEAVSFPTLADEGEWRQVVHGMNEHVRGALETEGVASGGTTLTAVVIRAGAVVILNVGDSRVLRLRERHLDQLTSDHNLASEMRGAGVYWDDRGSVHALTSYLGITPDLLRVEIAFHGARKNDTLILCSDGVHGQVPSDVIVEITRVAPSSAKAAQGLVDEADARGGRDNATAVVLRF